MSADPKESIQGRRLAILALGALGVVYGDIGTSPLYALKECFLGPHGVPVTKANVLGRALADFLVAQLRGDPEVPDRGHAGGQPW